MFRLIIGSVFCCLVTQNLWGQSAPKDSSAKTITLEEVSVCDLADEKNQSFRSEKRRAKRYDQQSS